MSDTELKTEIAYIKDTLLKEESTFLDKLKDIFIEGVSLEQKALEYKANSEQVIELNIEENKYKPNNDRFYNEKEKNIVEFKEHLIEERKKLEFLESLETPLDFYTACLNNRYLQNHVPVYKVANDYIQEQLLLFEKENKLKHFNIEPLTSYVNAFLDFRITSKNVKYSTPHELRYIHLNNRENIVEAEKLITKEPNNYSNYKKHIDSINKSLHYIEVINAKKDSFTLFKTVVGKTKREQLRNYYIKSIEEEKVSIYRAYSHLLFIKEALNTLDVEKENISSTLEQEEILLEIDKIAIFFKEKFMFNLKIV